MYGCAVDERQGEGEAGEYREAADAESVLREIARESPPVEQFEFVGYVKLEGEDTWIHDTPPQGNVRDVLEAHGIDVEDPDQGVDMPKELRETDAGRGLMLSADGRLFLEREDAFLTRVRALASMPEAATYGSLEEGTAGEDDVAPRSAFFAPQESRSGIHGSDQRTPVTSSGYPYRAVGQQVFRKTGGGSVWTTSVNWGRSGSSGSIGPRAVLTAAHVIANTQGDITVSAVGPAARGYSWNGDADPGPWTSNSKFPHGVRRVTWYAWPLGSFDGGMRYDYAVLTLADEARSPGWVRFGYQGTSWLNFKQGWNHYAYPGPTRDCANAVDSDGDCGGYMYHIFGETRGAYTYYVEHWLDNQPGHSGAPIYISKNGDRVIYLVHVKSCDDPRDCGAGKRLRSGSVSTICNWVEAWPSSFFSNVSC